MRTADIGPQTPLRPTPILSLSRCASAFGRRFQISWSSESAGEALSLRTATFSWLARESFRRCSSCLRHWVLYSVIAYSKMEEYNSARRIQSEPWTSGIYLTSGLCCQRAQSFCKAPRLTSGPTQPSFTGKPPGPQSTFSTSCKMSPSPSWERLTVMFTGLKLLRSSSTNSKISSRVGWSGPTRRSWWHSKMMMTRMKASTKLYKLPQVR